MWFNMAYSSKLVLFTRIDWDGTRDRILGSEHVSYGDVSRTGLIHFHLGWGADVKVQIGTRGRIVVNFREGSDLVAAYELLRKLIAFPDGRPLPLLPDKILLSAAFMDQLLNLELNLHFLHEIRSDPEQLLLYQRLEAARAPLKRTLLSLLAIKDAGILVTPLTPEEAVQREYAKLLESHGFISFRERLHRTAAMDVKLGIPEELINRCIELMDESDMTEIQGIEEAGRHG